MICNQQTVSPPGSLSSQWPATSSYTSMVASIKPEPQSFGLYGCQYGNNTNTTYTPTPTNNTSPAVCSEQQILENITDLKDIKLEDLCYLDNNEELNEFVLNDARSLEQLRSSVSPQSQYSSVATPPSASLSDLECCGGSPASSSADSWLSDQMVPSGPKAPAHYYSGADERGMYIDTAVKHGAYQQEQYRQQQYQQQHAR